MGILRQYHLVLTALLLFPLSAESQEFFKYETGLKSIKRDVKGQDLNFYDTRPYIQAGVYKKAPNGNLTYGTALNISPNLFGSDIGNQLHWKVLDVSKEFLSGHNFLLSAGALRHSKENPAWGYTIGLGYQFSLFKQRISVNAYWARTNTDIGGRGADTGAKDNMVWLDIGFQF